MSTRRLTVIVGSRWTPMSMSRIGLVGFIILGR